MRQSLLTVAMLVLVWLVWTLRDLVMLIAFAAIFAYALEPMVSWLERRPLPGRRTIPRALAAGLVILFLALGAGALLAEAVPRVARQFVRFADAAPAVLARLEQSARAFIAARGWDGLLGAGTDDASSTISALLATVQRGSMSVVGGVLGKLGGLAGVVLLPLFTFYILANRERARASMLAVVPPSRHSDAQRLLNAFDVALRAYVRGQALVCLTIGGVMTLVLQILGFPVVLLLGVVVGVAEIIPILGFFIAAAAIVLAGFSMGPGLALAGLVGYIVVNNLMQVFVSPRLLGREVKLHPFIVNVAVIGGGMLLGPAGAIVALPVAAAVKAVLDEFGPQRRYGSGTAATGVTTTLS